MKKLNVTIEFKMVGMSSIMVPDEMDIEEAIEYAKQHIDEINTPDDASYISGTDVINEDYCDFE